MDGQNMSHRMKSTFVRAKIPQRFFFLVIISLLPVFLCAALVGGAAYRKNEEGNKLYRSGKYGEALKKYTEAQLSLPESPELHYNIGNVLYRMSKYSEAAEEYSKALSSGKKELTMNSRFNDGNAKFMNGDYPGAVESYIESLKLKPDDVDAKKNLELALLKIQQKKNPQQQQEQDKEGKREEKKDQKDQKQDKSEMKQPQDTSEQRSEMEQKKSNEEEKMLYDALDEQEKEALRKALVPMKEKEKEVEKDW